MNLLKTLLLLTIFLIPLISATGRFGYEHIKIVFFIFSTSLMGFSLIGRRTKWTPVSFVGGLFILVLLFSSILGTDPKSSFLGREPYFQGWIVYLYLFLFYILVKEVKIRIEKYAFVLCLSAAVVSFIAGKEWILLNLFNRPIPTYAGRVVSTFGQPNFYAGFLLLILPFVWLLFRNEDRKLKVFAIFASLIFALAIFASYSRSAILIMLMLFVLVFIGRFRIRFKGGLIIFVITFAAVATISGILIREVSGPVLTRNPDLTKESVEKRAYIWPQTLQIVLKRPFTGYGLENIGWAFSNYFEENKHSLFEENLKISPVLLSLKELNIDRSHNYILDLLLFSGLPGFLAWVVLIIMLIARSRGILLVSLVTYLVWIQFQNQSIVHLIYFWLLAGLIDDDRLILQS